MPDHSPNIDAASLRVGLGFDVHRFAEDDARPLMLGGVRFEGMAGLAGHSDGDAVCHAVADGVLGAVGAGDVGEHFPESDPSIEGIAGPSLLGRAVSIAADLGWRPARCDVTVLADRPAIAPRRADVSAALAAALGIGPDSVAVKATRPEGLGLTGQGIGCLALVTLAPVRAE
jgi:2-C-methyl-D-erythritol 2,4-cyclodiphosphate synthase